MAAVLTNKTRLTDKQRDKLVIKANKLRSKGKTYAQIGEELGVSSKTAGRMINGPGWGRTFEEKLVINLREDDLESI